MIGIGIQPAGLTLAGLGDPEDAPVLPIPGKGSPFLGTSGDYVIDPVSGDVGRERSARHRVLLALRTVRKTAAADAGFGIQWPAKMGDSFAQECAAQVRLALSPCTNDGSVRIDDIQVERSSGRAVVTVSFTDLLTLAADKVTV